MTLTYTVQADDHNGGTTSQNVTITVSGTEDAPTLTSGTQAATVTEDCRPCDRREHRDPHGVGRGDVQRRRPVRPRGELDHQHRGQPDAGQRLRPDHGAARRAGQCLLDRPGASHDTVSGDGSIAWTYSISDGALDFLGANDVVTLTYTVQADDHNGGTTSQNVTITVSGTEDAPTLTSGTQAATVTENADGATGENTETHTVSGAVTFNDVDLSDLEASSITNTAVSPTLANGYALTTTQHDALVNAFSIDPASHDTVSGDGSIAWTYSISDGALDFLGANDVVTLTYTVQADDHNGGTTSQNVTITVSGTEDAPVAHADDNSTDAVIEAGAVIAGDSTASGNVLTNDTDADLTDAHAVTQIHSVTLSGSSQDVPSNNSDVNVVGEYGTLTIHSNGTYSYVLDNNDPDTNALKQDEAATDVFNYTMTDNHGATSSASLTINITGSNDNPIANPDTLTSVPAGWSLNSSNGHIYEYVSSSGISWASAAAAAAAAGGYLATITSADENSFLFGLPNIDHNIAWLGGSDAAHEGQWQWVQGTENGQAFSFTAWADLFGFIQEPNNFGNQDFLATSGEGPTWNDLSGSNDFELIFGLSVNGYVIEKDAPGAGQSYHVFNEDTASTISASELLVNDQTVDHDEVLSVSSVANSTDGAHVTLSADHTTITYDPTGSATLQALAAGATTTDTFTYTISDGQGGASTATVTLMVTGVNDAPVLTSATPTLTTITEDQTNAAGTLVSTLLSGIDSDVDTGALKGMAITGASSAHGSWQYSTNGGSSWSAFGSYSASSALLLAATDLVKFVPDTVDGSSDTFSFVAWDQTSGTHGTTASASTRGSTTAFSTQVDTASITVTPINNSPVDITAISPDTGASSSDFLTKATSLTVSGTNGVLGAGEKVQVSNDDTHWFDVTQNTSTTWSYADPTAHPANFTYYARVVGANPTIGNTDSHLVTIDTTAPNAPSITSVTDNVSPVTGTVADGGSTNDTTPTIRVSLTSTGAVAGDSVQLYNGTTALGSAVTLTSTDITAGHIDITTGTLTNGTTYDFRAGVIDQAGNTSAEFTDHAWDITIDTTAPNAPSITSVTDNVSPVTGTVADGGSTNDTTPTIRVSLTSTGAVAGDSVQLYNGTTALGSAVTLTSTDITAGHIDITTGTLTNGTTYDFRAGVTDQAGNTSTASTDHAWDITIDTTAPNAPSITSVTDNVSPVTGTVADGGSTNDTTPTIPVSLTARVRSRATACSSTTAPPRSAAR